MLLLSLSLSGESYGQTETPRTGAGARRVLLLLLAVEHFVQHSRDVVGRLGHVAVGPRFADGLHLALGRTAAPLDDARSVTEALALRSPGAGHVDHEGLGEPARRDHLRALLFLGAADLGKNRDRFGLFVFFEEGQQVGHGGADHRLGPGVDHGAGPVAAFVEHPGNGSRLPAGPGEDADRPLPEEAVGPLHVAAQPAAHRLAGVDDADGTGADDAGDLLLGVLDHVHDVVNRHALHTREHVLDSGVDCFFYRRKQSPAGDEQHAEVDVALLGHQCLQGVVDGNPVDFLPGLTGAGASHQIGAVFLHVAGAKGALTAGDPLDRDLGALVYENAHA